MKQIKIEMLIEIILFKYRQQPLTSRDINEISLVSLWDFVESSFCFSYIRAERRQNDLLISFSHSPVEGELAETGHHPDPGGGCLHLHQW